MATTRLTSKQRQLMDAVLAGADLQYTGWQQIRVTYGPRDERNYTAMQGTLYALRDRGLITLDQNGVTACSQ